MLNMYTYYLYIFNISIRMEKKYGANTKATK